MSQCHKCHKSMLMSQISFKISAISKMTTYHYFKQKIWVYKYLQFFKGPPIL